MSSIQVRVTGDNRRLLKHLQQLSDVDVKGINRSLAEGIRTSTVNRFRTEKSPEGKKWKSSIRAMEEGGKTLTQTSKLKSSIRARASGDGFAVGTNDIRAATLQFGDERTIKARRGPVLRFKIGDKWVSAKQVHVKIVSRPFLGISEEDEKEITRELEEALKGN